MNNEKKFLPIGTVCRLKEGTKKIMITGFCPIVSEPEAKMYDYCGCIYPEGIVTNEVNLVFDHSQIEEISFRGFENDEEIAFKKQLESFINDNVNSNINYSQPENQDINKNNIDQTASNQSVISQNQGQVQQSMQQSTNVDNNSVGLFNTLPNMGNINNE